MSWQDQLNGDSLSWLLEPQSPGVRYLALRDLLDLPDDHSELLETREAAHREGPINNILAAMDPSGFWVEPGPGYNHKYRSTVWAILLLAQLGASVACDERISQACSYLLENNLTGTGQFTITGAPSGTVDCLQGNMCWALVHLGVTDPRLKGAFEWMARSVTGEGIAPAAERKAPVRYYSGKCGPLFACGANNKQPCAWGAVKVMLALSQYPGERRSPVLKEAIAQGVDFLLSIDPATANYPQGWGGKPSSNWWKFGFPVFYVTDLLQNVDALARLGFGKDPRLKNAINLIREKQDSLGRWSLDYGYAGKTWVDFGEKKQPNKWVTLRALRVLKGIESGGDV